MKNELDLVNFGFGLLATNKPIKKKMSKNYNF